jgi:hypothetical protein
MPIVKQVKGNLVELFQQGSVNLIAQELNCKKVIEGNIAEQFAEQFPQVVEVDNEFPLPALYRLGDYSVCTTESGNILNLYTSLEPGGNFEYSALKLCLKKLSNEAIRSGSYIELTVPMFGANDPKANWEIIKRILNFQEHLLITVVEDDKGQIRVGKSEID